MHTRKSYNAGLIILIAILGSGLAAARPTVQEPPKPPQLTDEQRRRFIEMIQAQAAKAEEAKKKEAEQKNSAQGLPVVVVPPGQQPIPPPTAPPPTQPSPVPPASGIIRRPSLASDQVQLTYDNADLYDFVNQITDTLGITPLIIDSNIKGTVTIHSSAPMSKDDIFPLFTLILKNNNAALVKQGNIYQIVPISDALKRGLELIEHRPPESPEKPKEPRPAGKPPDSLPGAPGTPAETKPPSSPDAVNTPASQQPASATPPGAAPVVPQPGTPPGQAPASQQPASATPAAGSPDVQQPAAQPPPAPATQQAGSATPPAGSPPAQQPPAQPVPAAQVSKLSTHVIRAEFVAVRDLIEPLKLFMTEGGVIMPYDRLNMLIVTDYTDSVQKIMQIIRLLDDAFINPELLELIEIKYNAAADVADDLRKIFGSGAKESATGIYFITLDRINAILVMANSKRALGEFKRWVERLDATTGRTIQTYIYTVENSTASNIMLILTALFGAEGGGGNTPSGPGRSGSQGFGAGSGGAAAGFGSSSTVAAGGGAVGGGGFGGQPYGAYGGAGQYGGYGGGGYGGQYGGYGGQYGGYGGGGYGGQYGGYGGQYGGFGGGVFGGGSQLGPRLNQGPAMSSQIFRGGPLTGLQESVRIVANDINNTLVIQSSPADYAYLLDIIKKLDVLPRQVIIDARIFEVDLTDSLSFGVSTALQAQTAGQHLTTGSIAPDSGALAVGTFAFVGDAREILMNLNALRLKTKVRVLEAPSVLALDGTVARIVVGGEVPYSAGSFVGGVSGFSSVQYRDTGISLIVMPRISGSGVVTLDIAQEVSSPGAPVSVAGQTTTSFNKTSVATTLAVKDGETVAIAGLIRDNNSSSRTGVPFFSEIPLIGSLFGRTNRSANRTELLILISPHVIRTPERFNEMTQDLKDSLRNVRKYVDEKQREHVEDMENARKERTQREEKRQKNQEKSSDRRSSEPPEAKKPQD